MKIKISERAKHAILIGGLCSVSYLAVYIARNVLGAVSAEMTDSYNFIPSDITDMGTAFFMSYGVGQLINGAIGDKIKARYMISLGLLLAGLSNILFIFVADMKIAALASYAVTGFFLAMIYGPMTKVVAENTDPIHATRCSLGYTFASFMGSPLAGLLASFLSWKNTFLASSIALIAMAVIVFCAFLLLEKKGIVKYGQYKKDKKSGGNIKVLFKHNIVKFALIAILTGIIRTSLVQLLTMYFNQYLNIPANATDESGMMTASMVFSIATAVMASTTFITIFTYERLKRNMNLTIFIMFSIATFFFCMVYLISNPVVNVMLIVIAVMASNGAATMLWSRYCPSLYETGMVSSVTGFLDFLSYMSAAIANLVFGRIVDPVTRIINGNEISVTEPNQWRTILIICVFITFIGAIVAIPYEKIIKMIKKNPQRAS